MHGRMNWRAYTDIASAGTHALNEEATSSTDVLNCRANTTYAALAIPGNESARHDMKILRYSFQGENCKVNELRRESEPKTLTVSKSKPPFSTSASST